MELESRVAVVTGAGSGIGRVIAQALAGQGATLILVGRREKRLRETAADCTNGEHDVQVLCLQCDVGVEADVERVRAAIAERFGRCDIAVNCAGVFRPKPGTLLHESDVAAWDAVINTNLRGPWLLLRALTPMMIAQQYGRVINLTSGLKHAAGHGVYSISKSALDALTKTAAQELKRHNILVNALNPGWVRTEMATNAPDDPHKVVPLALRLATLPDGEPSGVEYHV
ncbi:MAG: 3-oxoacyl-[acyl-carrier protein] reductase [Abditibacteriota bacterium]|nr:3-oxoacyl-[acyl-carrier protein] reductase [Abditibacteriota bacterium]